MIAALMAGTGAAEAQEAGRVYKIGWLWVGWPGAVERPIEQWAPPISAFRDALRASGYVRDKNIVVDRRNVQGDVSRLAAEAEALVASKPDVIVSPGTPPTIAAMNATKTIPIVFPGVGLPVEKGIVASLAKPGGNVTGIAVNIESMKMWQLLHEVAPTTQRAGYLSHDLNNYGNQNVPDVRTSGRARQKEPAAAAGIEMIELGVSALGEIEARFAELGSRGGTAIYIATDDTLVSWRTSIMEMAMRHRLATACVQAVEWVQAGCLLTYGEDPSDRWRHAAGQVAKILKRTRPADIPVDQPTKFFLAINTKTAKALGLTVPSSLLAMADEVIE